jgi:hypothetical protein
MCRSTQVYYITCVFSFRASSEPFNADGGCINGLLCAFWQPLEEHVKVKLAQFCHVSVKMLPAQEFSKINKVCIMQQQC